MVGWTRIGTPRKGSKYSSKWQVLFFPLLISCLISPFVSATRLTQERERDLKSIGAKANVIKGGREYEREAGSN